MDGEPRYPNAVHVVHPADWSRSAGADHPNWARGAMQGLFELEMVEMPKAERLMGPINRAYVKRVNRKAMRRLKERLTVENQPR